MSTKQTTTSVNTFSWLSVGVSALVLCGVWYGWARYLHLDAFPTPLVAIQAFPEFLFEPDTWWALLASLSRMVGGYIWALAVAIPVGLAMGRSAFFYRLAYPIVSFFYPMPKAALMPILMLWFGLGSFSKVLVIALGASLPILFHSFIGASRVDKKMLWAAEAMGMGYTKRLFKVVLPAALPEIVIGCRVGMIMALIVMVSSEMIARQEGIGNLLFTSLDMAHYSMVYSVILVLAVLGVVCDWLFELLRKKISYE